MFSRGTDTFLATRLTLWITPRDLHFDYGDAMRTRSRLTLGTALAVVALSVTACGGGDDSNDTADTTTTPSASAATDSEVSEPDETEPPEETETEESESGGNPYDCDEVWVLGGTLPDDYDGTCEAPDGINASGVVECEDGSEYSTYNDQFFAKLGGEVFAGPDGENGESDPDLTAAYDKFANAC